MTTLTGTGSRTITGYLVTLLEYPRWLIDREVDFTHCDLQGECDAENDACTRCDFGAACCWLNQNRNVPSLDTPLPDLINALLTAVDFVRSESPTAARHDRHCDCDSCCWLREATGFLRTHRHKT